MVTMKRSLIMDLLKNKFQTILVFVLLMVSYLYLSGICYHANRTVLIKTTYPFKVPPGEGMHKNDTPPIKLTYYPAKVIYTITDYTQSTPPCEGAVCSLNEEREKIKIMPHKSQCVPISKCLTVNIKTRHRYGEVKAFIDTIHEYYPKLNVVVMDEFNPEYENSRWASVVANSPLITYAQVHPGVGFGRRMAAQLSDTPYVLVVDDDYKFFDKTNITKLINILENSDADIVSGTTDDKFPFAGAIRVSQDEGKSYLSLYPGMFYNVIPNYKNCYQADIVKTFFIARREVILKAGSWDISRPFYEHEDFFFQMRKKRLKIAYCDDVIVKHVPRSRELAGLRHTFFDDLKAKLLEKWELDDYFSCTMPKTYTTRDTCEEKNRKHFM